MQAHSNLQNAKMSIEEVMQYTAVVKRRSNYFFVQDFWQLVYEEVLTPEALRLKLEN